MLSLTIPRIGRLKDLALFGFSRTILRTTKNLSSRAPLLEKLGICVRNAGFPVVKNTLFNGNLLSLCVLRLSGALTDLLWKNMANPTTFDFRHILGDKISTASYSTFSNICISSAKSNSWNHFRTPPMFLLTEWCPSLALSYSEPAPSPHTNHLRTPIGALVTLGF